MAGEKGIRGLGGKNLPPVAERFDRPQKMAQTLAGGRREPRGVLRFKTWEEFNAWQSRYQLARKTDLSTPAQASDLKD